MSFNIPPRIFSLLLCQQVELDNQTGAWRLTPMSSLSVQGLPVPVSMVICANIMAPPGDYRIAFRLFHAEDPEGVRLEVPDVITAPPDRNLEYMARITVRLPIVGLYMVEAKLGDYHTALAPLRVWMANKG
jgi:hypothetical protein